MAKYLIYGCYELDVARKKTVFDVLLLVLILMFVSLFSLREGVRLSLTFAFVKHHRKTYEEGTNERQIYIYATKIKKENTYKNLQYTQYWKYTNIDLIMSCDLIIAITQ